jgi:hypothetical protein
MQPNFSRPTATKPQIKLDKKVKPLHWTRILLLPQQAPNRPNSVWDNIKEVELNIQEIAASFESKVMIK